MIYTRFGTLISITAYCGKHSVKGMPAPVMLVKVIYQDDGTSGFQFAFTLKADGGINEVEDAIGLAPELTLTGKALKDALKEAA